ncbi:uncharacterized protein [Oscarella lobularis]|uniref:uncharacterized protein n=1 Tax=Oscarella lobularis TaxID=121494 RepID=UPI00331365EC
MTSPYPSPTKSQIATDYERLSDVAYSPLNYRANFHAVVDTLSDVKQPANAGQSRVSSYFDGYVIDGTARIRFVCFNPQKHQTIASLARSGEALAFGNVLMKKNKATNAMEAHLQDNTSFMRSPKKIDLPNHLDANTSVPKKISIADVDKQAPDQLITVDAKVLELSPPTTLTSCSRAGSKIRRIVVGDQTGCCILTLWNDFSDAVEIDRSYTFESMGIKSFGDARYLYTPQRNGAIVPCPDLADLFPQTITLTETPTTVEKVKVTGISDYAKYHVCPACTSGRVSRVENDAFEGAGRCLSCGTLTLIENCQSAAYALLTLSAETSTILLSADAAQLAEIAQCPIDALNEYVLLKSEEFRVKYTKNKKIVSVEREKNPSTSISVSTHLGVSETGQQEVMAAQGSTPSKVPSASTAVRSLSAAFSAVSETSGGKRQMAKNRKK